MHTQTTTAIDGATLGWEQIGAGPPLLVVHGGTRCGKHYRDLAAGLSRTYTVCLLDRRGRGLTPAPATDDLALAGADLKAVLQATGATRVFGHSAGAAISLEAARAGGLTHLAVYEPPLLDEPGFPTAWLPAFEAALAAGKPARAFVTFAKGLQMGVPAWVPARLAELPLWFLFRSADGRELASLLATLPPDFRLGKQLRVTDLPGIAAKTLVLSGGATPPYLQASAARVAATIPGARHVVLGGQGHNAPDLTGPAEVAAELARFFE